MEAISLLDKIEFLISESLKTFRRNGLMTFAAVSTVAVALFLMGGLAYTYYQLSTYAERSFPKQFTLQLFLKKGTTYEQIKQTAIQLRAIPGVASAVLIPKEKAYPRLAKELNLPGLDEETEVPLPDAFNVGLTDLSEDTATSVSSQMMALPTVDTTSGVKYLASEQRFIEQLLGLLRLFGSVVGVLLFSTAGILIHNAIRLTIMSRRLEIRVMQLVGASRFTIRVPFLFEGACQGAVGGVVACMILWGTHYVLGQALAGYEVFGQLPEFPLWPAMGALAAVGAAYGLFSGALALSAPLRYR